MKNLNVIYEDNHIIVVEKMVNVPSQGDKTGDEDMLTIIKAYLKEKYNKPGDVYLGLIHRLDRPVDGKMESDTGVFEDYPLKNERTNTSKVVDKNTKNAKLASLDYEVLKYNSEINLSVVKVNLHTGRHHQIRLQFSSRGHSIYGDQKYGTRGRGKQICLWAYELQFNHPITNERLTFNCMPELTGSWKILEESN